LRVMAGRGPRRVMTVKLDLPAETATGNTLSRERSLAQTGSGYKS